MPFKFKNLMINVAPTGSADRTEAFFCGFGNTCFQFSCQAFTCQSFTCQAFTCHVYTCFNVSCYPFTVPKTQFEAGIAQEAGVLAAQQDALVAKCFAHTCPALSTIGPCLNHTQPCFHHTVIGCPANTFCLCTNHITFVTIPTLPGDPGGPVEQLTALKTQLQAALAEVEKQQTSAEESQKPQSVAEVEEIQTTMREAMDELEKRKKELQQKSNKP